MTNKFTVDDLVGIGRKEFTKRANAASIDWIPPRQNVFSTLCDSYSSRLEVVADRWNEISTDDIDINPSQLIKAAQDYQLSARLAGKEQEHVLKYFLHYGNIGLELRNQRIADYERGIMERLYISERQFCKNVCRLNSLLRALSETLYFDDHTVGGEIYGPINFDNGQVVIRSYKRLRPVELIPVIEDFAIVSVMTICQYDGFSIDIDYLGNIQYTDNQYPSVSRCFVVYTNVDMESICIETNAELLLLIERLEHCLKSVMIYYRGLTDYERQTMVLSSTLYGYKPIFDSLQMPWKPTPEEVEKYSNGIQTIAAFDAESNKSARKLSSADDISRIIDPRTII